MNVEKTAFRNTLVVLLSLNAVSSMSTELSTAFVSVFANALGSSALTIGLISAAYMGASAIANPCWGWISDRLQARRRFIILGLVFSSFFYALTVLIITDYQLLALRAIQGASFAAYNIALVTMLSESASEIRQGRTMGLYGGAQAIGVTIALLSGGWIAVRFGLSSIFLGSAVLFFANCLSAYVLLSDNKSRSGNEPKYNQRAGIFAKSSYHSRFPILQYGFLHVYLMWIVRNVGMAGVFVFLPLYVMKMGGDYAAVGTLLAVQVAPQILLMPLFGRLSEKTRKKPILLFGCTITFLGQFLLSFSNSYIQLILAMPFFSTGFSALLTGATTYITEITSSNDRGSALGLFNSAYYIADAIGPVIAAVVLESLGANYGLMFRVLALFSISALIITMTMPRSNNKNVQRAPEIDGNGENETTIRIRSEESSSP
jgi:MFS transporter, DHA1 family, multidrug resistance protein